MQELFLEGTVQTLYMVSLATIFSLLIGFPLGLLLVITEKGGIWPKPTFNRLLDGIINILRSIPFIILMIVVFPLSRLLVNKIIGTTAAIVPLSIAAAPFVARIMEGSFREIDKGLIEMSQSLGSSVWETIKFVLIPEALPSIVSGVTLVIINIIGYSAMAGAIGGGGLGEVAIRYGLYKSGQTYVMYIALILIIILVQGIQFFGNRIMLKIDKK